MRFGGSSAGFFKEILVKEPKKAKVKIILPIPVYHKMLAYAQASPGEISGLGRTKVQKKKGTLIVTVTDVRIFKQTVSSAETTLTSDTLGKALIALIKAGEKPERWNLWWHSHADFQVFFSSQDERAISGILGKKASDKYFFSVVINKDGDLTGRADSVKKKDEDADVIIDQYINKNLIKACAKEVAEKVTLDKTPTMTRIIKADIPDITEESAFKRTVEAKESRESRDKYSQPPTPEDWYLGV